MTSPTWSPAAAARAVTRRQTAVARALDAFGLSLDTADRVPLARLAGAACYSPATVRKTLAELREQRVELARPEGDA